MIDIPWYAIVISILAAAGVSFFIYKQDYKKSRLWKLALFFRFLGTFLLVLLFFAPSISFESQEIINPRLIVYRDVSASCDSQSLLVMNELQSKLSEKFKNRLTIVPYQFSKEVTNASFSLDFGSKQNTRIDEVVFHFQQQIKDESIAAGVIVSDGIVNQGKLPSFIDVNSAVPLYALGVGDSVIYEDLEVQYLIGNEYVYKQNKLMLETSLESKKFNGKSAIVLVKENGRIIHKENWTPNKNIDWTKLSIEVSPSVLGWVKYTVEIKGSMNEKNLANNSKVLWVEVVDEKKKIHFVYNKPHPDIKALKLALESKVQNELIVYSGSAGLKPGGDVYILHGYPSNKKEVESVQGLLQKQLPFWLFADNQQAISCVDIVTGKSSMTTFSSFQEVTTELNPQFGAFSLESDAKRWKSFGAVNTPLLKLNFGSAFQTQLIQMWNGMSTGYPLMGNVESNGVRSCWFFGNGIWRWRMNENRVFGNATTFDDWVSKNILWLAASGQKQKELRISIQSRELNLGSTHPIIVTHYDKVGLPTLNEDVKLVLLDSQNKQQNIPLYKSFNHFKANYLASKNGQFKLRAELVSHPEIYDEIVVSISKLGIEASNTVANFNLLRDLARKHQATFYLRNEIDKLIGTLEKSAIVSDRIVVVNKHISFLQIFAILMGIVFIFSAEWFLRKWLGRI
jgi:hypothetical protein